MTRGDLEMAALLHALEVLEEAGLYEVFEQWLDAVQMWGTALRFEGEDLWPPKFPVVQVSELAGELVGQLENAAGAFAVTATAGTADETLEAYSRLCLGREAIYTYLRELESQLGLERNITLRFF